MSNCDGESKQRFSMTLTATAWRLLDEEAKRRGTSRSEVIEQFARSLNQQEEQTASQTHENNPSIAAIRERTGEQGTLQAADRQLAEQRRDIQYAVARILAEAKTLAEATPAILQAVCENLGWQVGVLWQIDSYSAVLHCINYWQAANVDMQEFFEATQQITFARGVGLPWRVWATCQPHWISELSKDNNLTRTAIASGVGLKSGFGFPILLGEEILGVIECFSDRIQEADTDLLQMMAAVGSQIGQFIERKRTETSLRETQELFQSFMNHSPLAAFIKDESGRYVYVNAWVERASRHQQIDFIGKTDFELLPPAIAEQFRTNDLAVLSSGQPMQILETIDYEDGKHSYMSFKFPFRNAAGEQLLAGVALDISDRVRAEEELQQREQELRLIANAVPVLISFIDTQQRYRFTNQKYEEWFGKPTAEINGKYLWEVLGEAAYQKIRPYVEQVLAGQEVTFEARILYKAGDTRDAIVNYVPQFDRQGNVTGFVALVNDITHRKQAEEMLRQSEERLRIAQQAANAGVWDWDITSNRVIWSKEYYRLYGLDAAITQASYQNWLFSIIEEDRDRTDRTVRQALEHQIDINVEFRICHPTQGERWLTAIGQTFYDDNNQPIRMTGIALDITNRKRAEADLQKSEERFQLIAKATNDVIWDCHLPTNQMWWSERLQIVFGYQPEQLHYNRSGWFERVHPEDIARVHTSYQTSLNSDVTVWTEEYRFCRADNCYADVIDRAYIIRDSAGNPVRVVGAMADISHVYDELRLRKRAQRELQQTLQALITVVQASPLPIVVIEPNMTVQLWNSAAEKLFGWSAAEVLGQPIPIVPEEKRDECRQVREAIAKAEMFAGVETYRCKRDGSTVMVSISAAPLYDEHNHFQSILLIFQDITQQQQAEQALRQSEEWARLAIQVAKLGAWRLHVDSNLVEMDERMREIWGEPDDGVMIPLPRVIERMHPDDRGRVTNAVNEAIAPHSSGMYEIEYRIIWDDGSERWVLAKGQAVFQGEGESRQTIDFFGTLLDITDRKLSEAAILESEERYRYLAESIPQLVWTADTQGVLIDVNQRWCNFTGLTLTQAQTQGWQAIVHPDDAPQMGENWAKAQHNGSYYQAQGRMRRADGVYRWHLHQAVPLKNEQGQVIKWFGTATDIEDQKQLEQQRIHLLQQEQAAREQAETANRIKDEFLAVLSHELRTPLNPILGWSRLLQSQKLDAVKTTEALKTIERNAKLQAQLIEDLLDVSRILQGKLNLNVTPVDLTSVINGAIETVRLAAQAKLITIQTILPANVGQVAGDPSRLQQVVWNLLSNAIKFTPSGGKIEIRLERSKGLTQITVTDNGKGISPEFLPFVFDYFRQADSTTTRKFGGLGLGLAIVRHLVELHGGTVSAQSLGEGLGATFTVRLPLMLIQEQINRDGRQMEEVLDLNGIKVLLVDDDADSREFVAFVLEQEGADVVMADSATEALKVLENFHPDILLSDIGMPQIDGYMLIEQVRNLPPEQGGNIIAIALTAYAGEMNQKQAIKAGFQWHISKPVEPQELITTILELVKKVR
nr:PAS domain S-box protein [Nostoc sp. DedSLP01]